MITKEIIPQELSQVPEEYLDELYTVIQRFIQVKSSKSERGVLSRISDIKIQAPEDFAANIDLYLSGEKRVVEDENTD